MIAKLGYFTLVKNFGITLIIGQIRLRLTKLHINLKQQGIWIWFLFSLYDWTRPPSSFSCCFPKQKPASLHARGLAEGSKKGRLLLREATRKRGGRSSSVKCEKRNWIQIPCCFRLICNFVNRSLIWPIIKVIPKFLTNVK